MKYVVKTCNKFGIVIFLSTLFGGDTSVRDGDIYVSCKQGDFEKIFTCIKGVFGCREILV